MNVLPLLTEEDRGNVLEFFNQEKEERINRRMEKLKKSSEDCEDIMQNIHK